MILRRFGIGALVALAALIGVWACALFLLPDAPKGLAHRPTAEAMSPVTSTSVLAVPVAGVRRDAIRDSWGDQRDNGLREHHGTDVIAPANTPVLAAAPGIVEKQWTSAAGGTTLYVRSPTRTWTYYYAHLAGYAPGVQEGRAIETGQVIGYVGDTGNAGEGNFHLHFGLTRTMPDQHWYQGQDVDPFPYLAGKPLPR